MKDYKHRDKSAPYRTNKGGKISAPVAQTNEPRCTSVKGKGDLRGGK